MNYVSPCLSPELNNPKKKSKSFKNWTVILFPSSQRILIGPKVPQYNIQNVRDTQYVKNPGKSGQFSRKKKKIKSCLTQDDPDVGLSDSGLTAAIMIFFHMVKVNSLEIKDKTEVFNWKSKEQKFKNIKQQQNLLRFISLEPKKERSKRQTAKKIEEITMETFPNIVKDLNLQIQEAQWITSKINSLKTRSRYIIKLIKKQK